MASTDQPDTAVLGTWCDSPDHFISPTKVQTWLAEGDHARMVHAAAGLGTHAVVPLHCTPPTPTGNEPSRRVRFDEDDASAHEQATVRRHSVNRALEEYYKVHTCHTATPPRCHTNTPHSFCRAPLAHPAPCPSTPASIDGRAPEPHSSASCARRCCWRRYRPCSCSQPSTAACAATWRLRCTADARCPRRARA